MNPNIGPLQWRHVAVVVATFMLLSVMGAQAQRRAERLSRAEKQSLKVRFVELTDLCRDGDFARAAGYIAYRGPDTARKWKDSCNYANPEEKRYVDRICGEIAEMMKSNGMAFGPITAERESEGLWGVIDIGISLPGTIKHVKFAFLRINNRFYLGDID